MTFLQAVLLGIVEGATEFLPVSSTGHLILASRLLGLAQTDFLKSFEIAIQIGAILAVVVLYWRRFLLDRKVLARVLAAFVPTAVLGLLFYKLIKTYLLSQNVVLVALFAGGAALIVFEMFHREEASALDNLAELPYPKALLIGVFQAIAFVPGVSRAAATILGGLFLGMKRRAIVEFSFLLAVPTMAAATALDLAKNRQILSGNGAALLAVGAGVSFIVAIVCIRFFVGFIQKHSFKPFGVYRMAVAALFAFFVR